MNTKKLCLLSLLTAIALIIFTGSSVWMGIRKVIDQINANAAAA